MSNSKRAHPFRTLAIDRALLTFQSNPVDLEAARSGKCSIDHGHQAETADLCDAMQAVCLGFRDQRCLRSTILHLFVNGLVHISKYDEVRYANQKHVAVAVDAS